MMRAILDEPASEDSDLNPDTIRTENSSGPYLQLRSYLKRNSVPLVLAVFSLFYFAATCLRASEKYFWYDELYTLYICRLPTFGASWQAVLHGADFNPPLLYALTRFSNALTGEGLIGTRLPAIIGFWIFSLCLFRFVNRRCGLPAGFIAMTFPLLTIAYYYSYEARPTGIVLGFCGLALVFWQAMQERPQERKWLFGFALSLTGAFFSHCYAIILIVPFALTEAFSIARSHRFIWGRWAAMAAPAVISMVGLIPLFRSYRAIDSGTLFPRDFPATWSQISAFYRTVLTPSLLTLLLITILLLLGLCLGNEEKYLGLRRTMTSDLVLALSFAALPFFGVLLGKMIQGPFVARYFMPAVVGLAVLSGLAVSRQSKWLAGAVIFIVVFSLGRDFGLLILHRHQGWGELLIEPSTRRVMDTTPGKPLYRHQLLASPEALRPLPIVVPDALDFLYLAHYDPALRSRLYLVTDLQNETNFREYGFLRQLCHLDFNAGYRLKEFLQSNPEFLVYDDLKEASELSNYEAEGAVIKSMHFDRMHFLADMRMRSGE